MSARYVIRAGLVRGEGAYAGYFRWSGSKATCVHHEDRRTAELFARMWRQAGQDCRIVKLVPRKGAGR